MKGKENQSPTSACGWLGSQYQERVHIKGEALEINSFKAIMPVPPWKIFGHF